MGNWQLHVYHLVAVVDEDFWRVEVDAGLLLHELLDLGEQVRNGLVGRDRDEQVAETARTLNQTLLTLRLVDKMQLNKQTINWAAFLRRPDTLALHAREF